MLTDKLSNQPLQLALQPKVVLSRQGGYHLPSIAPVTNPALLSVVICYAVSTSLYATGHYCFQPVARQCQERRRQIKFLSQYRWSGYWPCFLCQKPQQPLDWLARYSQ